MVQQARSIIFAFVWMFFWAACSTQLTEQPKATGMATGQIHYVPACEWLARNILGSWHSKLPTHREFQAELEEIGRCNLQSEAQDDEARKKLAAQE
jgi:hypothetical protein